MSGCDDNIDDAGFRANVGIVLAGDDGRLLLAGRAGRRGWQFPQGGIRVGEAPREAMYRELHEELGLTSDDVEELGETTDWISYRLPKRYIRTHSEPLCIGQKQRWFALRLTGEESRIHFDATGEPEFDRWRWVDYWRPVNEVIYFKRRVYARALCELGVHICPDGIPRAPKWWPQRWRAAFDKDLKRAGLSPRFKTA